MTKRILFVDDEANALKGLQRLLRAHRKEWDMAFVTSGGEALNLLANEHFDVIVSDMQMPGIDGAELLTKVMEAHPEVMRIVLSGHTSRDMTIRSIGPTHQYLAKPCEVEQLRRALTRAFALQRLIANEDVRAHVAGMKALPTLPSIYLQLVERINSADCSIKELGELIATDPAMTLKILQLVNSAFFGIGKSVSDPVQAVTLLGLELVKSLVLTLGVFSQFEGTVDTKLLDKVWHRDALVGTLAKSVAEAERASREFCDYAQLAGLLQDIGILILDANFHEVYAQIIAQAANEQQPIHELEAASFHCTHAQIGAYLTGLWGLPDALIEAIAFHHDPGAAGMGNEFSPLSCVYVADALVHERERPGCLAQDGHFAAYLTSIDKTDRLSTWCKLVDDRADNWDPVP